MTLPEDICTRVTKMVGRREGWYILLQEIPASRPALEVAAGGRLTQCAYRSCVGIHARPSRPTDPCLRTTWGSARCSAIRHGPG